MRILPYRTLDNVIEGAVITFFDITERKKAQEALREAEGMRRLTAVVRDAFDAITVQDIHGRVLAWNPAAERMFGWSEAEALALNIRDRIPMSSRKNELALLDKLSRGEVLAPYQAQRIAKDGQIIEVWLTATTLVNEVGEIYAVATTERAIVAEEKGQGHD